MDSGSDSDSSVRSSGAAAFRSLSVQQPKEAPYTREKSAYGEHYRGL
jgi:hypothetical protein